MPELDTPKGIAASILGPSGPAIDAAAEPSPEEEADAETTAISLVADEFIAAVESKNREGLIEALRSLMTLVRTGG